MPETGSRDDGAPRGWPGKRRLQAPPCLIAGLNCTQWRTASRLPVLQWRSSPGLGRRKPGVSEPRKAGLVLLCWLAQPFRTQSSKLILISYQEDLFASNNRGQKVMTGLKLRPELGG